MLQPNHMLFNINFLKVVAFFSYGVLQGYVESTAPVTLIIHIRSHPLYIIYKILSQSK